MDPGKKAEGRSDCVSVCPDLQVLLLAGLLASVSGPRVPEPLVPSTTGAECPVPDGSRFPGKQVPR